MLKIGRFGFGKTAGVSAPDRTHRYAQRKTARLLKTQGRTIPWNHAAIYAGLVIAVGIGVAFWEHAYEAQQAALYAPPPPEVAAQQLVEQGVVGPGNVSNVTWDAKTGALAMTVKDVLIKAGQTRDEQRKNVSAEGELAIHAIQGGFAGEHRPLPKTITIHVTSANAVVATTSAAAGQAAPTTEFAAALR